MNVEDLYAAALLHDIGKFAQRTVTEKMKHQILSGEFCSRLKLPNRDLIRKLVEKHHEPTDVYEEIIALADKLSAGEREERDESEKESKNLISILSLVSLNGTDKVAKYKKISKLSDYNELLEAPQEKVSSGYKELWDEFFEIIKDETNTDRIYYILREYTSNVPSAYYYSKPDISLFSHLKSTAAIAVCLYLQFKDEILSGNHDKITKLYKDVSSKSHAQTEQIFCLIKGDVSGIQNFIYNIDMDNAVKNLKARSFYVSYLAEIVARYIVDKEGLTLSNILYCGGGHFYILAPSKSEKNLDHYREKIQKVMLQAHGLDLTVLLSSVTFSAAELDKGNFPEILHRVGQRVSEEKLRKFKSIMNNDFFVPKDNENICPYCKKEVSGNSCTFCDSFVELANMLNKKKFLLLRRVDDFEGKINGVRDVFKSFGYDLDFLDQPTKDSYKIEKTGIDLKTMAGYVKSATYMYNDKDGNIASLDDISKEAQGIKRWGILRGDLDNLGEIFLRGLGENKTLSRVATLSLEIEMFFGKFLEDLVRENYKNCMIIYSGGDDFFIIGPWHLLPHLAYDIRKKFQDYTGNNQDLTISMAIEIGPDVKFPVYRVAKDAGESLEMAKSYERNGKTKDAIFFLQSTLGWEEFEKVRSIKNLLKDLVTAKGVTRNIFQIIYAAVSQYERSIKERELFKAWRVIYYFSRLEERYSDAKEDIKRFLNNVLSDDNKLYNRILTSTVWADMETRKWEV